MDEASLTEVLAEYEKKGATGSFSITAAGALHCSECGADEPADQAPLMALHRFEGASDPSDESALAAIECPACGTWGTMLFSYGPESTEAEADVLNRLIDARDQSTIASGQ